MTYETECSGIPEVALNNTSVIDWSSGAILFRGSAFAQRFKATFKCFDTIQFYAKRLVNQNFHIEVRREKDGLPEGAPLSSTGRLIDNLFPYTDLPVSDDWVYESIGVVLTEGQYYWASWVPSDFYDSDIYRQYGYERFLVRNGTTISDHYQASYRNGAWEKWTGTTLAMALYKLPTYTAPCLTPLCSLVVA